MNNETKNNIDKNNFVPTHIQEQLSKGGWILEYSNWDKKAEQLRYKGIGMQTWKNYKYDVELTISYQCEKAIKDFGNKCVTLWLSDYESQSFAMRNIISVLKRRKLIDLIED